MVVCGKGLWQFQTQCIRGLCGCVLYLLLQIFEMLHLLTKCIMLLFFFPHLSLKLIQVKYWQFTAHRQWSVYIPIRRSLNSTVESGL